jgi:hypothetical protein
MISPVHNSRRKSYLSRPLPPKPRAGGVSSVHRSAAA